MNGKRPLTRDEQKRLLAHLKDAGRRRDHLFVLTGLRTGFRARELLSIQVKHFVFGGAIGSEIVLPRRIMKFGRSKFAWAVSGRHIPIHPELRVALEDYWQNEMRNPLDPDAYLFENKRLNRPISIVQAWRILRRACDRLKIVNRVALHSLRKSFAREVHDITRDLVQTQAILGHRDPATTVKYLELSLTDLSAVVAALQPFD